MLYDFPPLFVFNINTIIEKNQTFLCELVNLKRNGWFHYTKAFNNLTYNFWQPWTEKMDTSVNMLADHMKLNIRLK